MGRKTKFSSEVVEISKKLAKEGCTDEEIAERLGIGIRTLYDWKKKYPQFMQALKENKDYFDSRVEDALLKRALGYEYEETEIIATKDGKTSKVKKTKKVIPPDTTAIIFWLKNRQPGKWRNKLEIQHDGQIKTETNMQELSIEELKKLANLE
jgi:transposase-like protein